MGSHLDDFKRYWPRLTATQQQIAHALCRGWGREMIVEELHITKHQYRHALTSMLRGTGCVTPARLAYLMGRAQIKPGAWLVADSPSATEPP